MRSYIWHVSSEWRLQTANKFTALEPFGLARYASTRPQEKMKAIWLSFFLAAKAVNKPDTVPIWKISEAQVLRKKREQSMMKIQSDMKSTLVGGIGLEPTTYGM